MILEDWFKNNGMLLNEEKCQFLIMESARNSKQNYRGMQKRETSWDHIKCKPFRKDFLHLKLWT